MKNAQCKKCLNKFRQKDIYTIQQFQYRKEPTYEWSVKYFEKSGISEWDSFCEECMSFYSKESEKEWNEPNLNSLLPDKKARRMSQDPENLKKLAKEHSEKLANLGMDLGEIQFSYKIEEKVTKEYWQKRMKDFKKYNEKGLEYYNQVHSMMNLVNKEEAQMFLLRISKFRQLSTTLSETMEKIKENPSIIDSKDRQHSPWSKEIKNQITEQSNRCLRHEMDMNTSFREFYEKHLKKILE